LKHFHGDRVLILEDSFLIAQHLAALVDDGGGRVVGPAPSNAVGASLVRREPVDVALMAVHLRDGVSFGLARQLHARGIPVIFVTACARGMLPEDLRERPLVAKPFFADDVLDALLDCLHPTSPYQTFVHPSADHALGLDHSGAA